MSLSGKLTDGSVSNSMRDVAGDVYTVRVRCAVNRQRHRVRRVQWTVVTGGPVVHAVGGRAGGPA